MLHSLFRSRSGRSRLRSLPVLSLTATTVFASPVTKETIVGSWQLRYACMNDHGKPGACIEMKPGTLKFTFLADGLWHSEADDQRKTKNLGTFEIRKERLILKTEDGVKYQDWEPVLSRDGKQMGVLDKQLIETFERL